MLAEDLIHRPPSAQDVHDKLDGDACSLDGGLTGPHPRVHTDSTFPVHLVLPHWMGLSWEPFHQSLGIP